MIEIWQNIPSMAFKKGLYYGLSTIGEARSHGDFGVGQFAALDGELTVNQGKFYRATSDGNVRLADESDELCFAQLCFYHPQQGWDAPANITDQSFGQFLSGVFPYPNSFWAFRITGHFASIVPTSPPALPQPYPTFDKVAALRKSFPQTHIEGCIVGYYSPIFAEDIGIPGYHFHFISDDRRSAGHVTAFSLAGGYVDVACVDSFVLSLPRTATYQACVLP